MLPARLWNASLATLIATIYWSLNRRWNTASSIGLSKAALCNRFPRVDAGRPILRLPFRAQRARATDSRRIARTAHHAAASGIYQRLSVRGLSHYVRRYV